MTCRRESQMGLLLKKSSRCLSTWVRNGFQMGSKWIPNGLPFFHDPNGSQMEFKWNPNGNSCDELFNFQFAPENQMYSKLIPTGFQMGSNGFPESSPGLRSRMDSQWLPNGFQMGSRWTPAAPRWVPEPKWLPNEFQMVSKWVPNGFQKIEWFLGGRTESQFPNGFQMGSKWIPNRFQLGLPSWRLCGGSFLRLSSFWVRSTAAPFRSTAPLRWLAFSLIFQMGTNWFPNGIQMGSKWVPNGSKWVPNGFPMGSKWVPNEFEKDS